MVELALILPALMLFVFGGYELVRTDMTKKVATQLSREAANLAYRQCIARTGDPDDMRDCLLTCIRQIQNSAVNMGHPGLVVLISYYASGETALDPFRRIAIAGDGDPKHATRFAADNDSLSPAIRALPLQRVFLGEVYVPYEPVVARIGSIFHYEMGWLYDASVL